jgi:hypothetical protein
MPDCSGSTPRLDFAMMESGMRWLERFTGKQEAPAPLRGAPAQPRLKNYSALSGYAYEYVYDGMRDTQDSEEYVFTVSGDRKNWFRLSVHVPALQTSLKARERYAVAKLALFSAFDERENPAALSAAPVRVTPGQAEELLRQIGFEG